MTQTWAQATTRRALQPMMDVLDRHIERLVRNRTREVLGSSGTVSGEVIDLRTQVLELRTEVEQLRSGGFAVDLLLGAQGRRNSRLITEPALRQLAEQIHQVTGVDDAYGRVVQAYRMLFELELRGVGRLAGSAANVLGKLAATPLLGPPNGEVLEIGTLFGLFSAGMARQLNRVGLEYQLTIVDPLAEVQLQNVAPKPDSSGSPVTGTVVRANLALAGIEPHRFRLLQGFSGDPMLQNAISDRAYGVMIIDGDHSAGGVANDLILAERVVASRGIVVLDDYGAKSWPGVEQAVGVHLSGLTRFALIGVVNTTAFLRAR
jgi:hypothetical protein